MSRRRKINTAPKRYAEALIFAAVVLAAALVLFSMRQSPAQERFREPRTFLAERSCEATRAIRGGDPVTIEAGVAYPARGINKKDGPTHVLIEAGGQLKWVALSCGRIEDANASTAAKGDDGDVSAAAQKGATGADAVTGQSCLPFFDRIDNPIPRAAAFGGRADITPPPPRLDDFDRALMATCGPAGKIVAAAEFKALMGAHPAVLERVRAFTGGRVFAGHAALRTSEDYLSDLTEAWFAIKAFDHIFCGEPNPSGEGIGGLHFHGRYLQLQDSGEACRMPNYHQNEVVPGAIYTMGVTMKAANGVLARHARKGYGLSLSGEDILKVVTRAFAENPTESAESQGCLLPVADDGLAFEAVFVRRASGIRTFYPDATPNGPGGKPNPPCAGAVTLPPG